MMPLASLDRSSTAHLANKTEQREAMLTSLSPIPTKWY